MASIRSVVGKKPFCAGWVLVVLIMKVSVSLAQTSFSPVVITPPIVDMTDDNFVSMLSGKVQFTIPAVQLGDVSFTPFSTNGPYFQVGGAVADNNYGSIVQCQAVIGPSFAGSFQCATSVNGVQAIYGQERASFVYGSNGTYSSYQMDGSSFVDNVSTNGTCVWTKRDGTQIVFVGYHASGNPLCLSNNISQVIRPDGRVSTYYYYGSFSTSLFASSPILSIATNSGYLLKYNYSGTPTFGGESGVTAINRAFETCNPAATSCTLAASWPTAALTFQNKPITVSDNFSSIGPSYNANMHYLFTIQDAAGRRHVFELDSYSRVISYQPPQATSPVYFYNLCTLLSNNTSLTNCFNLTSWNPPGGSGNFYDMEASLMWDMVNTVTRNGNVGNVWTYGVSFALGSPPGYSSWVHQGVSPLGPTWNAKGNSTPGTESQYGPTDSVNTYDGTVHSFERNTRNYIFSVQTVAGISRQEGYDGRGNLQSATETPISGSGLSPITPSAVYPPTCTNIVTCNAPTSVTDANGNQSSFTYDPTHGGVLTVTGPAVSGIQPQTRKTYVQRYAWYLSSSGVMTRETRPIWLLATESYCSSSAASGSATLGSECALANDEVDTAYEYGADSGPNNLILRGESVSSGGVTQRTCYGHDPQGNRIWKASPNANLSSCLDY
jgi:hypothetical protein